MHAAVAVLFLCLVPGMTGCAEPPRARLNAPPQGDATAHSRLCQYFAYHDDQGMMADLSIADIHFVPHSPDLSGVGEARLARYAELLASSGGCIHYSTTIRDPMLIDARLARARAYLKEAVPSSRNIDVIVGLPGGRGLTAKEASSAKAVAQQAEPRSSAYKLKKAEMSSGGNK
jgi:hypothetical protein